MAHIVVNASSLRPGGGVQVAAALLSRFSPHNTFTVLWTDPQSKDMFEQIVGRRDNVQYLRPIQSSSNIKIFAWSMIRLHTLLKKLNADILFSINHHFPSGDVPQVVYHLNVLRFERPSKSLLSVAEIADRLRDSRASRALKSASANVFESKYLRDIAATKFKIANGRVIYIGIDEKLTRSKQKNTATKSSNILVLTSPQPHKDNSRLIHMLKALYEKAPDRQWKLKIAGGRTPEAFSELRGIAEKQNMAVHIEWLGFQSHSSLGEIAKNCLCLVSTSKVESFCMVALEAMTWGCPAIVANTTAMPESVGDAALIAEAGNADSFAEHVLSLQRNHGLRSALIQKGYAHIETMSWTSAANQFENLFAKLTKQDS